MEYILSTDKLCKKYRNYTALDKLSMHVQKGAIYGFIGRNGSGKTTLIRLICGLQFPTSGEYTLYGRNYKEKEIELSRRRIGAVVETPSIYLNLTAADNIKEQYRVLGRPSYEGIEELLYLVGLHETGNKKTKNFSLGMRQRLGIAVALAGNPDFLVLDEPINGLDPQGIVEMRELILKLNQEKNITVLISSHILDELSRLATHYGFIDNGRIIKEISAKQLEEACRRCMHLEVSNIHGFVKALDQLKVSYSITGQQEADVYGECNVTELVMALNQENCKVNKITEKDESLESYYINLVGGDKHE